MSESINMTDMKMYRPVLLAILAKDKQHCLPYYLDCIYNQDYPKSLIHLYIRTNNNNDFTVDILKRWLDIHGNEYASIYFDDSNVDSKVEFYKPHDWNETRFRVLGKIRQDSIIYAETQGLDYFVVDCDNFISHNTLSNLVDSNLGVIAPMLDLYCHPYSNFHFTVTDNGYFEDSTDYQDIRWKRKIGCFKTAVIHCVYYIRHEYLRYVNYFDHGSSRHEYVIVAENLRKANIDQYIDNRYDYGVLTFQDNLGSLRREPFYERLNMEDSLKPYRDILFSVITNKDSRRKYNTLLKSIGL